MKSCPVCTVLIAVLCVALVAVAGFVWWTSSPSAAPAPAAGRAPTVSDLMTQPDQHKGEVRVVGRVGAVNAQRTLFGLGDLKPNPDCSGSQCAAPCDLPVLWNGPMPGTGDRVLVTGSITPSAGGLIFAARRVERQ